MKKIIYLAAIILLSSCAFQRSSNFSSSKIYPGISKDEVIHLFGKPERISFYYTPDSVLVDKLYYRETILGDEIYYLTSILYFENTKLVSIDQRREREESGYYHKN